MIQAGGFVGFNSSSTEILRLESSISHVPRPPSGFFHRFGSCPSWSGRAPQWMTSCQRWRWFYIRVISDCDIRLQWSIMILLFLSKKSHCSWLLSLQSGQHGCQTPWRFIQAIPGRNRASRSAASWRKPIRLALFCLGKKSYGKILSVWKRCILELRFLGGIQEYAYTDYFFYSSTFTSKYISCIYIYIIHILHTHKIVIIEMFYPGWFAKQIWIFDRSV